MATFRPGLSDVERAELERWQKAAREIVDALELVLREPALDLAPTTPERFARFDARWYAAQTAALEALGFTQLGDVDGAPLCPPNTHPALIRVFRSPDGRSSGAVFVVTPKAPGFFTWLLLKLLGKWPRTQRIVEFMSYGTEGVLLTTTGHSQFLMPPGTERRVMPIDAPAATVWAEHQAALARAGEVATFDTLPALGALREQQRQRQHRWRAEVGLLPEELDALLAPYGENGRRVRPHVVDELKRRARGATAPTAA